MALVLDIHALAEDGDPCMLVASKRSVARLSISVHVVCSWGLIYKVGLSVSEGIPNLWR